MTQTTAEQLVEKLIQESETQEHIFWGKELVVSYKLPSGFTILGRSVSLDSAQFDIQIARARAKEDVKNQLNKLENYLLLKNLETAAFWR